MLTIAQAARDWIAEVVALLSLRRIKADEYIRIGEVLEQIINRVEPRRTPNKPIPGEDAENLTGHFKALQKHCDEIRLATSSALVAEVLVDFDGGSGGNGLVHTWGQIRKQVRLLRTAIHSEIKERLFLFLPPDRAIYYPKDDAPLGRQVAERFPKVEADVIAGRRAYAFGLDTAAVFHHMRALEIGLWAVARKLEIKLEGTEQWKRVIDDIESYVKGLEQKPRTKQRLRTQTFYSEAAKEFRYFKDAWRNHVMHARVSYEQDEAARIMAHVGDFIGHLATKLRDGTRKDTMDRLFPRLSQEEL